MVPSQRDPVRSKEAILTAAESLFARHGYDGTSLADIAVAAKVSRGLPSYFFEDKAQLYAAVLTRAGDDVRKHVLRPIRSRTWDSSVNVLISLVERYIDYFAGHQPILRLLQGEFTTARPGSAPVVLQELFQETLEAISPLTPRPLIRGFDAGQLLLSCIGMCLFPMQTLDPDASLEAFVTERKRHVTQLLRSALGTRP